MKPYYLDEWVTIYHGDCREILPELPKFDLVLTSPPYDNLRDYGGYSFDFNIISRLLYEKTLDGGVLVWVVGDATIDGSETGTSFRQALRFMEVGYKLHDTMIYAKNSVPINAKRYEQNFEYMFVFSLGSPRVFNPIMRTKLWEDHRKQKAAKRNRDGTFQYGYASSKTECVIGNIWYYDVGGGHVTKDKIAYQHPAIFPEKLAADHIISWTNTGDTVLDPMCGSGTVLKEAKKLNRKCIGIEIEEKYCEIAAKRCSQSVMELNV